MVYVGLDIGGTKIMAAAANEDGAILRRTRKETPVGLKEGLQTLKSLTVEMADGEPIGGIGAAIGGPLDWKTGVVSPLHQPEWREVALGAIMSEEFGCRFSVDVDTNIAALGEYEAWQEKPSKLVYITLSTGMGGGFVVDGALYRGAGGAHPEVAHQSIHYRTTGKGEIVCECGAPDCLEALVSGNGIRRVYGKPAEELSPAQWKEVAFNLGQGLRNVATLYAPDVVVLGGGVAVGGGEGFLNDAVSVMKSHLRLVPAPDVRLSEHGYDTALAGALYVAHHGIEANEVGQ